MSFYADFLVHAPLFSSTSRVSSLDYLDPTFRAVVEDIMEEAAAGGNPLIAFETYRSQQRQHQLYQQGSTQIPQVGCHHFGVACDLVKSVGGDPSWKGDFSFLGILANKRGLVWGGAGKGNLNIGDNDHIQWCAFHDQPKLFNLSWYPSSSYVAWS